MLKRLVRAQRGFTLIELLIVVAILGIIAMVAIPNVAAFMTAGTLNAANTEAQNVRTAGIAYFADHNATDWPDDSGGLTAYLTGPLKAEYTWDQDTGLIVDAHPIAVGGWTGIHWVTDKWVKGE